MNASKRPRSRTPSPSPAPTARPAPGPATPSAPASPAAPPAPPPTERALLAGSLCLAALAFVPWGFDTQGVLFFWHALARPDLLLPTLGPTTDWALPTLALVPLGAVLGLAFWLGERRTRPAGPALMALVGALGLALLLGLAPTLAPAPQAPFYDGLLGFPLAPAVVFAAAGLAALRVNPASAAARVALTAGLGFVAAAALLPFHRFDGFHWPLTGYLTGLTGVSEALSPGGLLAFGLALVPLLFAVRLVSPRAAALTQGWLAPIAGGLVAFYPLWYVLRAVLALLHLLDTPVADPLTIGHTVTATIVAALVTVFALWAFVGLRALLLRADAPAGFETGGYRRFARVGLGLLDWGSLFVVFALFLLLKTHGMRASVTDENLYFYGADLWARGVWPYRDFFFAHPPLHLLIPALLFKVFGFSLLLGKTIPVAATVVSAACVVRIGRRHFGKLAALLAVVAFLFATELLKASTNFTGINLSLMFFLLGLTFALEARFIGAGVWLGLAVCTGFYTIAGALAVVTLTVAHSRRAFVKTALPFVVVAGGINAVFAAIGGSNYVEGVYAYHGKKPEKDLGKKFATFVYYHAQLLWGLVVAPLAALFDRALGGLQGLGLPVRAARDAGPERGTKRGNRPAAPGLSDILRWFWTGGPAGTAALLWLVTAAFIIEFMMFKELYDFYFILWLPTLALLLGYGLVGIGAAAVMACRRHAANGAFRRPAAYAALGAVAFALWLPVDVWALGKAFPEEVRPDQAGQVREFAEKWSEPPVLPQLAPIVKTLFWRDTRVVGEIESGFRQYLWSKKRYLSTASDMARYVAETTVPGDTISGSSAVAPLIALLSGRELSGFIVDTNGKRFKTGNLTWPDYWKAVCNDRIAYIVSAEQSPFEPGLLLSKADKSRAPVVRQYFRHARTFDDPWVNHWRGFNVHLFRRTGEPGPNGEPVCAPATP